jgi:hypothetical protein
MRPWANIFAVPFRFEPTPAYSPACAELFPGDWKDPGLITCFRTWASWLDRQTGSSRIREGAQTRPLQHPFTSSATPPHANWQYKTGNQTFPVISMRLGNSVSKTLQGLEPICSSVGAPGRATGSENRTL